MHPALSLNTLSCDGIGLAEAASLTAWLGIGWISPTLEDLEPIGAVGARKLLDETGLRVATLTHRSFAFDTAGSAAAARDRLFATVDIAAAIGAPLVTMTTGGRGNLRWGTAAAYFAEAIRPCAERAEAAGVVLSIEPTSHLYADASIAHRLADTVALANAAGIAITMDLFACWFDSDIDDAIAAAATRCALVQVSDYIPGDRGLPCRAVPGDGCVPLDRLIPAIVQSGFAGPFDLEIIGPRLAAEGIEASLRRAATYVSAILAAIDAEH